MEFKSLEEIQKHFGLSNNSLDDIRRELVVILAEYHPDKSGGTFANKIQERNYEEIGRALEFIDESKKDISITKHELSVILKKIEDLSIIASTNKTEPDIENKISEKLNGIINESIIQFHKKYLFPKITSIAVSGLLTILWAFPSIALEHPILKHYALTTSPIFISFWFFSLFLTGFIWFHIKRIENKDEQLKKRFSFDSTQSSIFKLFLCWTRIANPRAIDYNEHRTIVRFTKDELINFTINHYNFLEQEYRRDLNIDNFSLYILIQKDYKDRDINRIRNSTSSLLPFSSKIGEIDVDFANQVSESIINKLIKKKIITVSERQSFSDSYEYLEEK